MANENRIGGITRLSIDGVSYSVRGNASINLGQPKREGVAGLTRVDGYTEKPQVPGGSCEITDVRDVSMKDTVLNMTSSTVSFTFANGKEYFFEEAFYVGDGNIESEEGKMNFEFQAMFADELTA
jgi:hypothetical protein